MGLYQETGPSTALPCRLLAHVPCAAWGAALQQLALGDRRRGTAGAPPVVVLCAATIASSSESDASFRTTMAAEGAAARRARSGLIGIWSETRVAGDSRDRRDTSVAGDRILGRRTGDRRSLYLALYLHCIWSWARYNVSGCICYKCPRLYLPCVGCLSVCRSGRLHLSSQHLLPR